MEENYIQHQRLPFFFNMSSLRMINFSSNSIHFEWGGPVCLHLPEVWRGTLTPGNCCVMCNLTLFRRLFSAKREEDCKCDRGINLCLRLLTEMNCVHMCGYRIPDFMLMRSQQFLLLICLLCGSFSLFVLCSS